MNGVTGQAPRKKKIEREDEIDEADGEQNPEQHFGRERRAGPQHLIEQNVVSGRHGVTILARGARSRNSASMREVLIAAGSLAVAITLGLAFLPNPSTQIYRRGDKLLNAGLALLILALLSFFAFPDVFPKGSALETYGPPAISCIFFFSGMVLSAIGWQMRSRGYHRKN